MSQNFSCLQARKFSNLHRWSLASVENMGRQFQQVPVYDVAGEKYPTSGVRLTKLNDKCRKLDRCSICQIRLWCILNIYPLACLASMGRKKIYPDRCFMWGYLRSWRHGLTTQNACDPNAGFFRYVIYFMRSFTKVICFKRKFFCPILISLLV